MKEIEGTQSAIESAMVTALPGEVQTFLISKRSASTRASYQRTAVRWLAWCVTAGIDWRTARQVHVDLWREVLTADGLANATVANRLAGVSALYASLVRQGVVHINPAAEVERPVINAEESDTQALDEVEAAALMAVTAGETLRTRVTIGVLLTTGLRISELVAATVPDLQLTRGQRVIKVTRKGGKVQRIALPNQVGADLDLLLAGREEGPILATSTGKPIDRQYVHALVRRLAAKADIPAEVAARCGPHALRRTAATILLDAEVPLEEVRDLLGHADARTTQRYNKTRKRLAKQARHVSSLAAAIYPEDDLLDG